MTLELTLMRHGEPSLTNCLLGQTDLSLSAKGWQQMVQISKSLTMVDRVISSPLIRCHDFARNFAESRQLECYVEQSWGECDFGDWDGLSYQDLSQNHTKDFENFIRDPHHYFPQNGEKLAPFSLRVERALQQLVKDYPDEKILLVTHSGVIRMIVAWCLNMDRLSSDPFQRFKVDYASLTKVDLYYADSVFPQLKTLNRCVKNEKDSHG